MRAKKSPLDERDSSGKTALFIAVAADDEVATQSLLDQGASLKAHHPSLLADVRLWDRKPLVAKGAITLLHVAAHRNAARVIPLLCARVEVDALGPDGETPLHVASRAGAVNALQVLLKCGASIHARDAVGYDVMDHVRDAQTVTALLAAGADPNGQGVRADVEIKDYWRWPLFARKSEDIVAMLIAAGASAERQRGALGIAAHYGQADLVRMLLDHGADADEIVPGSPRALAAASAWGRVEVVKLLLAHGSRDLTFALACAAGGFSQFSVDPQPEDRAPIPICSVPPSFTSVLA